jgi:hypothetical protein
MDTVLSADAVSQEEAMQCWDEAAEEFAGRFIPDKKACSYPRSSETALPS